MNFIEKNGLYIKLKETKTPEADEALLKEKNPAARSLATGYYDSVRRQNEILLDLIDVASENEIRTNRNEFLKKESGTSEGSGEDSMDQQDSDELRTEQNDNEGQETDADHQKNEGGSTDELERQVYEKLSKKDLIEQYGQGLDVSEKNNKKEIIEAILASKKKNTEEGS